MLQDITNVRRLSRPAMFASSYLLLHSMFLLNVIFKTYIMFPCFYVQTSFNVTTQAFIATENRNQKEVCWNDANTVAANERNLFGSFQMEHTPQRPDLNHRTFFSLDELRLKLNLSP